MAGALEQRPSDRNVSLAAREEYQRKLDRIFEVLTWFVGLLIFVLAIFFYQEEIEAGPAFLLTLTIFALGFIFYRVLPRERFRGTAFYSFEDRGLLIGLSVTIAIGFLVFISGGLVSPFFFFYYLILIILTIILPPRHLLFELAGSVFLITLTALFFRQASLAFLGGRLTSFLIIGGFTLWLSHIIKENRERLERMTSELARLNELKSDFISLTFNQIRDPLTALRWFLHDTVLIGGDLTRVQKRFFYQTYDHILKVILLLNILRDLAMLESEEEMEAKISRVDVAKLIEDTHLSYKTSIEWRGINLQFKKPEEPMIIQGGATEQLSHVFHAVIANAIRYSRDGGTIRVRMEKKGREIQVSIEDIGIGIPEEEKGHIFEKFFRGKDAKYIDPSGAGIGLYTAKKIVEAHKGKIWFESEYGKGTTFHIVLSAMDV